MPGGDGTGPRGLGPMTGRARGNCILKIPDDCSKPVEGFIGLDARYVSFSGRAEKAVSMVQENVVGPRESGSGYPRFSVRKRLPAKKEIT